MKKLAVLFSFVFLLLLSGGQHFNVANNQVYNPTSHTLEKKHRVKFTNQDTSVSLMEEADLNFDEEHGGDLKDGIQSKIFIKNFSLLNDWYLNFSGQSLLNLSQKNFKIFTPFCGQSNPIYITQRVLRL